MYDKPIITETDKVIYTARSVYLDVIFENESNLQHFGLTYFL